MGKPTTGPDGVDILAMMNALGALHSGHVEVNVRVDGIGFAPRGQVRCQMSFDVLPGSSLPKVVIVESPWPCAEHRELDAHVYAGLHQLDFEISKVYKNEKLWQE